MSAAKFLALRQHTQSFNPGKRFFKGKDGREYHLTTEKAMPGKMFYKVHHQGNEIGSFYMAGNGADNISVTNASVDDDHQRNGIATHVYNTIENDTKHLGLPLLPQGKYNTSDDGKAFWKSRDPEKHKLIED